MIPIIEHHLEHNRLDRNIIWLSLIASEQKEIMELFINHWQTVINLSIKSIFLQAITKHKHFLNAEINEKMTSSMQSLIQNGSHIISMAHAIIKNVDKSFEGDVSKLDELFTGSWNKFMYIELCRLKCLQSMLIEFIPDVRIDQLNCCYNLIDYLCQTVDLTSLNVDKSIQSILIENAKYNFQLKLYQPHQVPSSSSKLIQNQCTELVLYQQFTVIKLILQIIQHNHHATTENYDTILKQHVADVKRYLQCIETLPEYIRLLKIIFSLIFLRWEHICVKGSNGRCTINNGFDDTPNSAASDNDGARNYQPKCHQRNRHYEKYGFMCNANVVDCILKLLKYSATTKKHSDELLSASVQIQNDFQRIYENINDACWRLSLFLMIDKGQSMFQHVSKNLSSMIVQHCSNKTTSGSSDDDDNDHGNGKSGPSKKMPSNRRSSISLMRRKPPRRKQQVLRKSDSDMKSKSLSQSTENERKSIGDVMQLSLVTEKRCIVSRMLGSAEHLVTTCMSKGDVNAIKHILKVSYIYFSIFYSFVNSP